MKKLISIIIPVFNEEENIDSCYEKLKMVCDQLNKKYNFEFIFTDNASTDKTFTILKSLQKSDKNIRIFKLSKNFGYQRSIWTGYTLARGDAAIEFDCDLQDPPELLPKFLEKWEMGFKIIYGIRKIRKENYFINTMRKTYYRLLNRISNEELPINAGDFMLIDRILINLIKKEYDPNIYLRGTIFGYGFPKIGIEYARNKRYMGESKFNFTQLFPLARDGIISQSTLPLKMFLYIGILIFIVTTFLIILYLILWIKDPTSLPSGFTTLVIFLLFSISLNNLAFGVLGHYLARLYKLLQKTPMSIIEKKIDFYEDK